ncbi:MAG: alpha/beta fold hydrolase [Deltaproteobacteria bacterium]|nr:alpha/beta fold hydrolase [Deltaproteobacteria bacterium]
MPYVTADDGVKLYCEEAGEGYPIVFVHEFAGDHRSYESQIRYFARRYRCIAYNARGYPPSEVPDDEHAYSQERARDDIRAVLDGLRIDLAHLVGISMGGFATLHFGMAYPERARSLVVAGCGYGAEPGKREQFETEVEAAATRFETLEMESAADSYALGATRVQLQNKDKRGWEEFRRILSEHSARGSALTLRGVQMRRPSLYGLVEQMGRIRIPTLIVTGDEDDPCIESSILMKRTIPSAALVMLPRSGHAVNLEEPALFNQFLEQFFHQVESGRWELRDPRSVTGKIL